MASSIPLPALDIKPPADPLSEYAKVMGIKSMMQQQQTNQLQQTALGQENQQRQISLDDSKKISQAYLDAGGDLDKFQSLAARGGVSAQGIMQINQHILTLKKSVADLDEASLKAHKEASAQLGPSIQSVLSAPEEDQAAQYTIQRNAAMRDPALAKYAQTLPPQYPGPDALRGTLASMKTFEQLTAEKKQAAEQPGQEAHSKIEQQEAALTPQERAALPGLSSPAVMEMKDWLAKNPGKGPSDYEIAMKKIVPAYNFNLQNNAGGGLSDTAKDQAAERYATTGILPPVSRGAAGLAQSRAIMNRAAELHPTGSITANSAEYHANADSLKKIQSNFDQVTAFENTAGKNLDQFLAVANKIADSGSPWINKPLRALNLSALGSEDQAAANAARATALTEIAKVLNSSNASGVLSDSARGEVNELIGKDATFKQVMSAAKILKTDMANRHQSYQEQIQDIQKRLGNTSSQSKKPAGATHTGIGSADKKLHYLDANQNDLGLAE